MTAHFELGPLSLSPDQIDSPAFFVDRKLSVRWMAQGGTDPFSQTLALELASANTRNILDILLRPGIKSLFSDWQSIFAFVYLLLRRSTSREVFDTATVFISKSVIPSLPPDRSSPANRQPFMVDSFPIHHPTGTTDVPRRIFALAYRTGTLFLLREDHFTAVIPAQTKAAVDPVESGQAKKAICVLSARLNDSQRISDSMLPEVYFKLINRIWDAADDVMRSLGGVRAGSSGAEIKYMFTENMGRDPIFSALCCATRLNRRMPAVEKRLKTKGWVDQICLNMGISHGTDDLAAEATDSMELMVPGGASDQSSLLSSISAKGEIWITKKSVTQLPKKLIDRVVLGVDRQGQFFRNFFVRIADLPPGVGPSPPKPDLGTLSIARVVEIEHLGVNQPPVIKE